MMSLRGKEEEEEEKEEEEDLFNSQGGGRFIQAMDEVDQDVVHLIHSLNKWSTTCG
jgi:hypothetical protein